MKKLIIVSILFIGCAKSGSGDCIDSQCRRSVIYSEFLQDKTCVQTGSAAPDTLFYNCNKVTKTEWGKQMVSNPGCDVELDGASNNPPTNISTTCSW